MYKLSFNVTFKRESIDPSFCKAVFQEHGSINDPSLPSPTLILINDLTHFYFKLRSKGVFSFCYDQIPVDFSGNIDFYYQDELLYSSNLNPQEAANTDTSNDTLVTYMIKSQNNH